MLYFAHVASFHLPYLHNELKIHAPSIPPLFFYDIQKKIECVWSVPKCSENPTYHSFVKGTSYHCQFLVCLRPNGFGRPKANNKLRNKMIFTHYDRSFWNCILTCLLTVLQHVIYHISDLNICMYSVQWICIDMIYIYDILILTPLMRVYSDYIAHVDIWHTSVSIKRNALILAMSPHKLQKGVPINMYYRH